MTPPAEGQEKDVLLVLDKQQGKVSAVKGIDKEGNLQTVPPTQGGEFMQVDKNSDVFSNFISNFFRKFQDTSGLELFSVKASEVEQNAKAIEDNHRNPTPEGGKRAEMLRVPKPDFHEFKQGYRFDPAKIDWENLKKVGITADTLKNTRDFDRVMRGYKSRNTYTVSGTVGGFYLKPTDVKLSFYQAKDGTVVPKLHGVQQDENCCNARSMNTSSPSRNRTTCKALATWAASLKSKTRKAASKSPCSSAGTGTRTSWSICGLTSGNAPIQSVTYKSARNRKPPLKPGKR